jgi:hypothetical protein
MATETFQVLYTSLFEMNYNLCKKQVNETVWKKIINLILIKKYLRPYFAYATRQKHISLFIIIYNIFILIKKTDERRNLAVGSRTYYYNYPRKFVIESAFEMSVGQPRR